MYTHPFKSCAERLPLCLALAALPAAALANVGVPLIWATSGQLLLINIIIAMMVETVVAERLWGNLRHPFRLFLAANYFSTLSGSAFLATGGVWLWNVMIDEAPLYRAIPAAQTLFALSWILSVLLEWPFCFFMVGRGEGALRKALCISLAAQVASYAILVPYYYVFSNDTLYRNMDIRKDLSFVRRPAPVVYYIGLRDGDIWLIRADGTGRRKVREANITDPYARLTVRPRPGNPKGDIWLIVKDGSARSRNPLLTEAASRFALHPDYLERGSERDSAFNFSSGPDFRPEGRREWTMFGDFWGGSGTDVRRNRHGVYKFGFDLPFMFYAARWNTGNFNYLPGDQAVFQMGPQILVLDMPGRKIALLTAGRGPVAAYE